MKWLALSSAAFALAGAIILHGAMVAPMAYACPDESAALQNIIPADWIITATQPQHGGKK